MRRSTSPSSPSHFACPHPSRRPRSPRRTPRPRAPPTPLRGKDSPWMRMHEGFLEQLKPGTTDLIFIGDSITQGWGGGGKAVWDRYYAPARPWARASAATARSTSSGGSTTASSTGSPEGRGRDDRHEQPQRELARTRSPRASSSIVGRLRDKLPKTKVLLLGVFPRSQKPDATRDRVRAVNDQIKSSRRRPVGQVPRHRRRPSSSPTARSPRRSCPTTSISRPAATASGPRRSSRRFGT